ncbi:MAG: hypothetical protein R3360_03875 [Alphaproteobacteria bacterium]|nr:hypothetical protein [Alphaproteobacteria bacterium]
MAEQPTGPTKKDDVEASAGLESGLTGSGGTSEAEKISKAEQIEGEETGIGRTALWLVLGAVVIGVIAAIAYTV